MRVTATLARYKVYVLIPVLLFLVTCTKLSEFDNQQIEAALSDSLFTTTESWNVDMEILEDGHLIVRLTGSYAATIKNEQRNITKISGPVYIEIYNDEGMIDTIVDADSAVHHPLRLEFELFGNVDVKAPEGKRLRSDYLMWQRRLDRVSTPEFVIFISPPDSISAKGFVGNTDLTNYTLNEGGGRAVIR